ncbi:MAG: radical SAM protein [bacterium]
MLCNHKCFYCYNPACRKAMKDDYAIGNIIELVKLLNSWGTFDITFTGGEPFINKKVLYAGIEEVKKTHMDFGINTNASLITRDDAKRLKDFGVASLFVSFPSYDEKTFDAITGVNGSYKDVIRGLDNLSNEGLRIATNMVIVNQPVNNVDHVYKTAQMLIRDFEIIRFCFAPISPNYKNHEQYAVVDNSIQTIFDQIIKISEEFKIDVKNSRPLPICALEKMDKRLAQYDLFRGCTMGVVNGMTIDLNGNFKPCPVMQNPIGNVFQHSLQEIKELMSVYDGTDINKLKNVSPDECFDCKVFDVCKGGCKTEALAVSNCFKTKSKYQGHIQDDTRLLEMIMKDQELVLDTPCRIKPTMKWRQDSEDVFIVRGERFALLNKYEFDILNYLQSLDSFNPLDFVKNNNLLTGKFNVFLNKLNKAKLLII